MKVPKDVVCLIPTWITARHAVGAANSMRKYYPNIPIYFVDDEFTPDQEGIWKGIYNKGWDSYSNEPELLVNYPNSCYIRRPHIESETDGHGLAITHAMQFIHAKWIVHISTDCRLVEEGAIEYLFKDINNTYCGSGEDWTREGRPALGSWLFMFRGDLYHKYNLDFKANREKRWDIGSNYYHDLIEKGYNFNKSLSIMNNYLISLGSSKTGIEELWEKYY